MRCRPQLAGFYRGLKEGGFVEGQNLTIDYRWAKSRPDRLPAMAADLVRRRVAVIFGGGGTHTAAKNATTTIPIVFATGGDPVGLGLVTSLARPGGSIGLTMLLTDLAANSVADHVAAETFLVRRHYTRLRLEPTFPSPVARMERSGMRGAKRH